MSLPHQQNDKQERERLKERHHPIHPSKSHRIYPLINVKCHAETKANTKRIENDRRLSGVVCEALADVIYCDGCSA